ncbi:MAG: peptide chain release factor N(5)-glutamine methyltransferase [Candidatus Omnitrophica bacterium]|nr:peptide chain release factor N(5)-glutamine methyltransferase [Candidatus Omnitrophota bacterium]
MNEHEQMLTSLLDCRRVDLYVDPLELTTEQKKQYTHMVDRWKSGEPLQYIIGHVDFSNTKLFVNEHVLIPRPETELLVEIAITKLQNLKNRPLQILDLGTGSGNIAIALARKIDECHVTAVDISPKAISLAESNAKKNFVEKKITFVRSDMFKFLEKDDNSSLKFDMIISNPPYIKSKDMLTLPRDVRREPHIALDGGKDGLDFYRGIIDKAGQLLTENGFLLFEIGEEQAQEIRKMIQSFPYFQNIFVDRDYADQDRFVYTQYKLTETRLSN